MNKVFVYGTLKRGFQLYLGDQFINSIDKGTLNGKLYNLGVFPALKLGGNSIVKGEIHEYDKDIFEDILEHLDRVEGEGIMYNRIHTTTNEGVGVWVYEYRTDPSRSYPLISNGEWIDKEWRN